MLLLGRLLMATLFVFVGYSQVSGLPGSNPVAACSSLHGNSGRDVIWSAVRNFTDSSIWAKQSGGAGRPRALAAIPSFDALVTSAEKAEDL